VAKVENRSGDDLFVPALNRVVKAGDVVEVPDDLYESFVPPKEVRSPAHPWGGVEAPTRKTAKKAAVKKES